ncbi:accessory factor UbiK family protein [Agitococcus lubricus]|nr:accessory factor UbiK family protein [Agitococcus lubricus]
MLKKSALNKGIKSYFGAFIGCFCCFGAFLSEKMMALDNLVQKIREQVKERYVQANQSGLWQELDKNLQAVLQETFAKMELVTREEFDRQAMLLAEARQRLHRLDAQLKSLEQQIQKSQASDS